MKRSSMIRLAAGASLAALVLAGCSSTKPEENTTSAAAGTTPAATSSAAATSAAGSESSAAGSESSAAGSESSAAGSESGAAGSGAAAPSTANEDYKVAFIQGVTGDNFYITMQCGIEEQAKKLGVTVDTQGPTKFDPTLQKPILDSVVASKPDAILIAPTDVAAMQGPLAAAAGAGIKIVLVDTTTEDPSFAVSQVASDNVGGGAAAFDAIKGLVPGGGKVLVISVDPGISTTDARVEGFQKAVADDGTFTDLGVQYSHNDPATAASLVTSALQKDPDIVGIFATNLFAAQGAATGIEQAGKKDAVKIVGFDAGPDQIQALKDGVVQALVAQQPGTIGVDGLNQAVLALNGEEATPKIQTGFSIITKDNVDTTQDAYKAEC
jgi:ribose transport system substrate-binding protein